MLEVITNKWVKARKEHNCSWCHGLIKKGELYQYNVTKQHDGDLAVFKAHKKCERLISDLGIDNHDHDGMNDDLFGERIQEYLHDYYRARGNESYDEFDDWYEDANYEQQVDRCIELLKEKENANV